ncbi:MAG: hypothetical protein HQL51_14685, partial [Magnetococcales bacterium]|nr:hypothetical protein [Magnetococcales bacterium]
MGYVTLLKQKNNWLNPESAEPPNLPDDLEKQGNPVTGHFAKKLEVWR